MRTAVVLLTRDLRVHDHPALAAAHANAAHVVPLFVLDPALLGRSANRDRFLHQCLADLRDRLRRAGGDLVVRHGDPVAETIRLARDTGADGVAVTRDVSAYARRRERRLADECRRHRLGLRVFPGVTVVDPGTCTPAGGDHYRVFTPFLRAWQAQKWRTEAEAFGRVRLPDGVDPGELPEPPPGESPAAAVGGETAARRALRDWLDTGTGHLDGYADRHDDLAADGTSRLSPYLRFGCLSSLTVANAVRSHPTAGADAYVRQLAWRDFFYQVTAAFPALASRAYRPAGDTGWRGDDDALRAWQDGRTGVPVVDAGLRQLREQGWMHNRARLITAAFLTKHLGLDWRAGVAWFARLLLDGDVANNAGNWQWVAGTGNDTRPYRRFNPVRQALRFDPDGAYVRRFVPELAGVPGPQVHQPWRLPPAVRRAVDYPPPLEAARGEAVWLRP